MKDKSLSNGFLNIVKKMNNEIIGQGEFIHKLCNYFKEKFEEDKKGILLLAGKRGTFKKASVRLLFEKLNEEGITEDYHIDEIDLASYNFNLGYNAFLSDLYEKLNSSSQVIMFKNTEKASENILKVLSEIYPNTCLKLKDNYIMKNKFLIEAKSKDKDNIGEFICHNKFFIFIYNSDDNVIEDGILDNREEVLYTESLTEEEQNKVIRREVLRSIDGIQKHMQGNIVLGIENKDEEEDNFGICSFLQENFIEDSNFGISEYISYKIYKPIMNLIQKEGLYSESQILIYVDKNEIYCKSDDEIYKLENYLVPTLEEVKYKLDSIIGIEELKNFIINVENNWKVQKIRKRLGLKTSKISMNMIFTGNAGTGKTNAARVTFEYLNALGILTKGVFVEVSKADFVTENINDTSKRTNDVINSALGGVLFIDEAYSLCESEEDKVGKEIVDALLKGIEDNRDNLIVILAGYEKDMERFLTINQGLKSRFSNTIHFKDYNPVEMYEIAVNIAKSKGYRIAKNVKAGLIDLFTRNQIIGKNDLGNARFVRNIVENAIIDASKKYLTNNDKEIDLLDRDNFNFRANAKFDLEEKLNEIIGLDDVKKLLRSQYKLIVAQEKRKSVGVNTKIEQNLNMV